jgi:N-acetylmuramoyl-L-alanine amidase
MPMNVVWKGCDAGNYKPGRKDSKLEDHPPEAIVIHLMDGSIGSCDNWFNTSPADRKKAGWTAGPSSAHYGIGRDGVIHQYVSEVDQAYHAGRIDKASWKGLKPGLNPNLYTIGIEHEGKTTDVWTEMQIEASAALIAVIAVRWHIPLDREHVVGHNEIFALKACPGPHANLDLLIQKAQAIEAVSAPEAPKGEG